MAEFTYSALNKNKEIIEGVVQAESESDAMKSLQKQGLIPISLDISRKNKNKQRKATPSSSELLLSLEQLLVMLNSGLSLYLAVNSLSKSLGNSAVSDQFARIAEHLGKGLSFSAALASSKLKFPPYIPQLIKAGELSGKLNKSLQDGVEQFRYEQQVQADFKNAMVYPIILIISGFIAVSIIFTFVVPRFVNLLDKVENLPILSVIILSTGKFANENWPIILGSTLTTLLPGYLLWKNWQLADKLLNLVSRVPGFKKFFLELELGRWSYLVGTLLSNQVPILDAIQLANEGVRLPWMRARLYQVVQRIKEGNDVVNSLKDLQLFPAMGLDLISVGEKSGKLAEMLKALSNIFSDSSKRKIQRFLQFLEPLAILILGLIIGLIMAGIILAITSMNDVVL